MSASDPKSLSAIGFLAILKHRQHGLFGGYLILNTAGRPLEFHCTAPVKPNRAQEILYGPMLEPYLYGEQIGQTLVKKAKIVPRMVWTNSPAALAVREFVTMPVALVLGQDTPENKGKTEPSAAERLERRGLRLDGPHHEIPAPKSHELIRFRVGTYHLAVSAAYEDDRRETTACWQPYADSFDLLEPFDRIRAAIGEAQKKA